MLLPLFLLPLLFFALPTSAQFFNDTFASDEALPRNVTGEGIPLGVPGVGMGDPALDSPIVLANGLSMQYGTISPSVQFQASGILLQGCTMIVNINPCFQMMLAASGQLQPGADSPRQRIEFLSTPFGQEGEQWRYRWRYRLSPGVASGPNFFHMFQLLSRDLGGYVIALDLISGSVVIRESVPSRCGAACPSIPQSAFLGITTSHDLSVTYGDGGSISYTVRNAATNALILQYNVSNSFIPAMASAKMGIYRAVVSTTSAAQAFAGAFNFQRLA
ncbi:hypothetical protein JCM10213_008760 [Rhodosporidiobolus nylandii]